MVVQSGHLRNIAELLAGGRPLIFVGMTPPKLPIRNCPFCRIAMIGRRAHADSPDIDIFECMHCDTVIHIDSSRNGDDVERAGN